MAMNPGMKMLMVAKAGQGGRMERGYGGRMETGNRMAGDYSPMESRRMGGDDRMAYAPEMRRRRDSRGRYMGGDDGTRMEYGASEAYRPWPEPHIPPYLNDRQRMEHEPQRMRDKNIVNIRDYQDKRRTIGFEQDGADPRRMHSGQMSGRLEGIVVAEGHGKLTREKAEKWVKTMHGSDPKVRGEMWSYDDAKVLAEERGIPTDGQDMIDFYVVLNMVYNDYAKVAKDHGIDTEDYFADLACAWLYDPDGKPPMEKLLAYKQYVIPHGEE